MTTQATLTDAALRLLRLLRPPHQQDPDEQAALVRRAARVAEADGRLVVCQNDVEVALAQYAEREQERVL